MEGRVLYNIITEETHLITFAIFYLLQVLDFSYIGNGLPKDMNIRRWGLLTAISEANVILIHCVYVCVRVCIFP